jgi:plastocyanin
MKKLLVLLISCLALGLMFAACGGDDDDDDSGGSASTPTTEQTDTGGGGATKPSGSTETVDMKDIQFVPKDVTVKAGTTITWTNSDQVAHTVTKESGPGGEFDSGNVEPGDTFELTVDAPGKVDYVCQIHPGQAGTFTVK